MSARRLTDSAQHHGFPAVERCYSWTWNDFHMTPHSHDRAEVMYLLRGKCRVQVYDQDDEIEMQLGIGEFVFIDAGVIHALQVDESCYMVNVEFGFRQGASLLTLDQLRGDSSALQAWLKQKMPYQRGKDNNGSFFSALSSVVDGFAEKGEADEALNALRLGQMLVLMAKALQMSDTNGKCLVHVRRCIKILSERMDEDVRIDDIAASLGISSSYLQRIFRQVQKMTIIEYLNRLRVERAKLLLINTKDSIIDIAFAAGFNSRQHFSRVFADVEGCSPLQFRQNVLCTETKQVFERM